VGQTFLSVLIVRLQKGGTGRNAGPTNTMDDKLANDEARRSVQHESVKAQVEGEVQAEIAEAQAPAPAESQRIQEVAGDFRAKAVDEVIDTEREVERGRGAARISQIIDYIFFLLYALLGLRFLLALLAARSSAGFVQFIVAVTNPFYLPFRGIVASPTADGGHTLLMPIVIAIIAYALLHLAINGLLRMVAHRKTAI
jgi:YGGT family